MALRPLCAMILLISVIRVGQAQERPRAILTLQPDGQIFSGQDVTFTCEIQGYADTEWTYNWNNNDNQIFSDTENRKYSFTAVESASGKYTCSGRRKNDSQTSETSNAITLTVSAKPTPTVSVRPQSSVYTGDTVTLSCNLQSTGWMFFWYKARLPLFQVAKDTNILDDTVANAGIIVYQCQARRGDYNSLVSDPITITVRAIPKPVVSIKPDEQVYSGETVTLRCEMQDDGDSYWTYSWNKDGAVVSSGQEYRISGVTTTHAGKYTCQGTERKSSRSSHTSAAVTLTVSENPQPKLTSRLNGTALKGNSVTLNCLLWPQSAEWKFYWMKSTQITETVTALSYYTLSSVRVSDGGQYRCRAGRGNPIYYTHYSDAFWVNVTESPKAVVIIQPDKHVFRGETVTLRCEIQGGGDTVWTYSWYKNDYTDLLTAQEFNLSSVRNDVSGKYTCSGWRSSDFQKSEISDAVTLTVSDTAEAVLIVSPLSWLNEGDSVTLSCEVKRSSAGWTFSWYTAVPYREKWGSLRPSTALISDSSRGSGGSYTLSPVTLNHTGLYMCRAGRGEPVFHTAYSKPKPLWIIGKSPPVSLIISPSRTQHFFADSLSLSCNIQSDATGWTVNGFTHSEAFSDCSSVSGSTCNISFLYTSHTGVYWCQSESGGRSNPVNITVHYGDVILDSPVHPVIEGHPLTLRCLYHNTKISDSVVDFYKNDSVLQNQTTGEMTIRSVSKSDEGFYHCKHPQRGESPKGWVSVSFQISNSGFHIVVVAVGLSLALLFIILLLILLWWHKSNKGKDRHVQQNSSQIPGQNLSQSGAGDPQPGYTPLQTGSANFHATEENTDDTTDEPSGAIYAQAMKKEPYKNKDDDDAGPSEVTYIELEHKPQKKAKKKQVKANVKSETVYSELKLNT
ncbi:Fc receptor-like protein 5 isoform X2 [Neoarius graeffei]|uniref:Fc receptor-like protein 5 isoform X2 n=1 Tax=Neoarius graeffei TaxID=443677 RepID=UPI00298C5BDE|nr:Fc receptor-like protein 5 isoform X2 [Neoarius graeffei]